MAALPPMAGLTGDARSVVKRLNGFGDAMVVAAHLVGSDAIVSALGLGRSDLAEDDC